MKLDTMDNMSVTYELGSNSQLSFWHTIWSDNCSLATRFPHLYQICSNKTVTVDEIVNSQGTVVTFRRSLGGILYNEWTDILCLISSTSFTHHLDKITWRWETSRLFTVRSL